MATEGSWGQGITLLLSALGMLGAYRMIRHPQKFFGSGEYDAHDPKTVRFFGGVFLVMATLLFAASLYGLAGGRG